MAIKLKGSGFMLKIADTKEALNHCFEIRKQVFVDEQGVPPSLEIDQYEDEATHVLLTEYGCPIATGRFREYKDGIKIERVAVIKSHRKLGLGKKVLDYIEYQAKSNNKTKFYLNAQTQAIPFYESLGYYKYGDVFKDAGISHYAMVKEA